MIVLGHGGDDVDDVGYAAGAFAALLKRTVNLCGNDDFPRILAQKIEDDVLDFAIGDDVALADEHGPAAMVSARHKRPR